MRPNMAEADLAPNPSLRGRYAGALEELTRPDVSVIIPTLNEVENIDAVIEAVTVHLRGEVNFKILIADGGSQDGTVARVKDQRQKGAIRLVQAGGASGLAGDVLCAAKQARAPVVVVMDADLSHPAAAIIRLVAPIRAGESDMVIGSRHIPGGSIEDWPLRRRILSRAGALLAWPLTDLTDPMSGFFAIRREHLLRVDPGAAGFKIGLEAVAAGGDDIRVQEIPITFRDRTRGASKIGLSQMTAYLRRLAALSGGATSTTSMVRFGTVGALGLILDLLTFHALLSMKASLGEAHIASFAIAAVFNYVLNARWSFSTPTASWENPFWRQGVRFLYISMLALSLRGGVLATATNLWEWPTEIAALAGIIAAAAVSYIGSAFFVFSPHAASAAVSSAARWRVAAVGVVAYVVLLRLAFQGVADLIPQEAYYWNYAQRLDIGYLDHPPMTAWLIWSGSTIFGDTEFVVRLGAGVSWIILAFFSFFFARNLFGNSSAFITLLLLSSLPFFFAVGTLMTPDAPLAASWAGALYFLERAILGERRKAWLGAGICVGLGLLSKYTIALLGPATLALLLLDPRSRGWLRSPWPYLAGLLALLFFSPVIAWNASHDWASFAFQTTRRLSAETDFSLHLLVGSILLLITPLGLVSALWALKPSAYVWLPFSPSSDRRRAFVAVYTLTPLAVFAAFSLTHEVKLNWTAPVWLAALPAIAHGISLSAARRSAAISMARAWQWTIAGALLIYGGGLHYLALGLPGIGYPDRLQSLPIAWREFATTASEIERSAAERAGEKPLLVGMDKYHLASVLGFYRHEQQPLAHTTSRNLFGGDGLMYRYWFRDAPQEGRTVVMFGLSAEQVSQASLRERFRRLGPVHKRVVYKEGFAAGEFYYRIGYGFRRAL